MFILDRLLVGGLSFVFEQIRNAAESELEETPEKLGEELINAQMQLELGEISEDEFAEIEGDIFARMRALRGEDAPAQAISFGASDVVEVSIDADEQSDA